MWGQCVKVSLLLASLAMALRSEALACSPKSSESLSYTAEATPNSGVC